MGFPFPLLSDADEKLCALFDVIKMKNMYGKQVRGIERSTFGVDGKGGSSANGARSRSKATRPKSWRSCARSDLPWPRSDQTDSVGVGLHLWRSDRDSHCPSVRSAQSVGAAMLARAMRDETVRRELLGASGRQSAALLGKSADSAIR